MAYAEFSESSYSFAITHNIVEGMPGVSAVPRFPSRWAEGQPRGGYDVEIPRRLTPLFLQYKVPSVLTRRSKLMPPGFRCPYYRMHLRTGHPNQHGALLRHSRRGRLVFYAVPRFHEARRLNEYFQAGTVLGHSRFFRPNDIGRLDASDHFVAYHRQLRDWWVFSEPEPREMETTYEQLVLEVRDVLERSTPIEPEQFFGTLLNELHATLEELGLRGLAGGRDSGPGTLGTIAERAAAIARAALGTELIVLDAT